MPVAISESLAIDGAQFAFQGEVTGQVDLASLTKIGCAGPFPVYSDADPASGARYVTVGTAVFQYAGDGARQQSATRSHPRRQVPPKRQPKRQRIHPNRARRRPWSRPPRLRQRWRQPKNRPLRRTQEPSATSTSTPTEEPTATSSRPRPRPPRTRQRHPQPRLSPPRQHRRRRSPTDEASPIATVPPSPVATGVPTVTVPAEVVDAASSANAPAQIEVKEQPITLQAPMSISTFPHSSKLK